MASSGTGSITTCAPVNIQKENALRLESAAFYWTCTPSLVYDVHQRKRPRGSTDAVLRTALWFPGKSRTERPEQHNNKKKVFPPLLRLSFSLLMVCSTTAGHSFWMISAAKEEEEEELVRRAAVASVEGPDITS